MSRLIPSDIQHIRKCIRDYDAGFMKLTNMTMAETANSALHISLTHNARKTAVIPVTSGLGVIDTFCDSVCAILQHIGVNAFVTEKTDVAGIQEAYLSGAEILFLADDDVCAAFSTQGNITSDNGYATGIAFAAALKSAMTDTTETVLVLGAGPVGTAASHWLCANGMTVALYDPIIEKSEKAAANNPNIKVLTVLPHLEDYRTILDATPIGGWIRENDLSEGTVISAPGMPLSLTPEAVQKVKLIHNPLELGIITMYYDCVSRMEK